MMNEKQNEKRVYDEVVTDHVGRLESTKCAVDECVKQSAKLVRLERASKWKKHYKSFHVYLLNYATKNFN